MTPQKTEVVGRKKNQQQQQVPSSASALRPSRCCRNCCRGLICSTCCCCRFRPLLLSWRSPRSLVVFAAVLVLFMFFLNLKRHYAEETSLRDFMAHTSKVRLTPKERKIFRYLLESFHSLCQANNVTYFLFAGTMLGMYRIGDILPWDDDIDVVIPASEARKLIGKIEEQEKFSTYLFSPHLIKFFSLNNHTSSAARRKRWPEWVWPFLDVFLYYDGPKSAAPDPDSKENKDLDAALAKRANATTNGTATTSAVVVGDGSTSPDVDDLITIFDREYKREDIFPVVPTTLLGVPTFLPRDTRACILNMFGPSVFSTCKTSHYDHREDVERHRGDQTIDVECRRIAHNYAVNGTFRIH